MKTSQVYMYQAQRIRQEALAAGDSRAVTIVNFLLNDLQRGRNADIEVSGYARQLLDEARSPLVQTMAYALGEITLQGDAFYSVMAEAEAEAEAAAAAA